MSALPGENVGAVYMDNARYMAMYLAQYQQTLQSQPEIGETFDNIYTSVYSYSNATPDPNMQKEMEARKQQREVARRQQEEQLQKLRDQLQTLSGGSGVVMTYDPAGLRIDSAAYVDPAKATAASQALMSGQLARSEGRILNSVPASALLLIQGAMSGETWQAMLSPEFLATQSLNPSWQNVMGMTGKDLPTLLTEFEQKLGVNLKDDLLGQFDGELAFIVLPKAAQTDNAATDAMVFGVPSFSVPFEIAAMIDSKDAAQAVGTLDKISQAVEAELNGEAVWQKLTGQPYSVLTDKQGDVMLAYGVVDGRVVIGSNPETLQAVDNADQAPLTADADFKDASSHLPGGQPATMYFEFGPIFDWYFSLLGMYSSFGDKPAECGACNYLKPFKYLVSDSGSRVGDVQLGSMFIKIEAAK
jgi:phosphate uptake regulator